MEICSTQKAVSTHANIARAASPAPTGAAASRLLADKWQGERFNAPNDIVVNRKGHVYFTDPLFTPFDQRQMDFHGVCRLTPDGKLDVLVKWTTRPNEITLSPNQRILYVANSDEQNIWAYDLDSQRNASNPRIAVPKVGGSAGTDGIRADVNGNVYAAADGIEIYSPAGKLPGRIGLPEKARNPAVGDKDFKTLSIAGPTTLFRVRMPLKGAIPY